MENETDTDLQDIIIDPGLVVMNLEASSDQEALDILAHKLLEWGYVKESYVQAVKDREKTFATGLAFEIMGIALPHTDSVHVIRQSIAIGVLKKPVTFKEMGTENDHVNVELIFMLAIKKSETQIDFLGKMLDVFQGQEKLKNIKNATSPEEITKLFKQYIKM